MLFDAIVVAGGRSSRLGGTAKSGLVVDGETLLERAIDAASAARRVVVVGPVELPQDLDDRLLIAREQPPFGGPVAAVAAGVDALDDDGATTDYLLVLACDMPRCGSAVPLVLDAADTGRGRQVGGFIAVDEERHPQPLLAVYDRARLSDALEQLGPGVGNLSMRALLSQLDLIAVEVPPGSTDDIDTWADAARFGIHNATKEQG